MFENIKLKEIIILIISTIVFIAINIIMEKVIKITKPFIYGMVYFIYGCLITNMIWFFHETKKLDKLKKKYINFQNDQN